MKRERWLTVVEVVGFGAIAGSLGAFAWALFGALSGASLGVFVAGVEAVYLANAYSIAPDSVATNSDVTPDA